jgi:hypothetical protein
LDQGRSRQGLLSLVDNAEVTSDPQDVINARLLALGQVIEWSASMEEILRSAFCSLVGSKYAAILAGGQTADGLIEDCKALTRAHHEMSSEHSEAILAALERCKAANQRRNALVHGVKTASRAADGALQTIRSRRRSNVPAIEPWTPQTISEAAGELLRAGLELFGAMQKAVSPEVMVLDQALAWEERRRAQGT